MSMNYFYPLLPVAFACASLLAEVLGQIRVDSKIVRASFVAPLPLHGVGEKVVEPSHVFKNREHFSLEMEFESELLSLNLDVESGVVFNQKTAKQVVSEAVVYFKDVYVDPIIELAKRIETHEQEVFILTMTGAGGRTTAFSSVYVKPNCVIRVEVGQLDFPPHPKPDREKLACFVEEIIRSLQLSL